tara:strand:+ start:3774 stop:3959 length:186 start_codon:yes stop_codon:yes gene_type:complete
MGKNLKSEWCEKHEEILYYGAKCGDCVLEEADPERTHILGGFVHGKAICSDECWCKAGEEE